jgi:hypothetical protein
MVGDTPVDSETTVVILSISKSAGSVVSRCPVELVLL